ncbi:general odorant-binding protein 72-like [Phlebotomus argentipes]|uniref:general odorant-binding protein 72-like n=1 Tax=Phlebotomus argentipes TaxID=94469 RepID=UPI00289343DC|nr:general odorant-binding protein 72-like [Phlebotomus argentipes]
MAGKAVILCFCVLALFFVKSFAITVDEAKNLAKIFSEPCKDKHRVSNELIEGVNKGDFPDNRSLKCYANCMLELTQTVARGRINYRMSLAQIDLFMPEEMKEPARMTLEACRGSMKGFKDHCEASYNYVQCMYKVNRKYFFFP